MPSSASQSHSGSSSRKSPLSDDEASSSPDPAPSILASTSLGQYQPPRLPPVEAMSSYSPSGSLLTQQRPPDRHLESSAPQQYHFPAGHPPPILPGISSWPPGAELDHFRNLRKFKINTKEAWTAIPASEGSKIMDLCRSLSTTSASSHLINSAPGSVYRSAGITEGRLPCYSRETIYDEEWQAHMKNVHGVFLIWPETWMRRIEVLDLDAFGGDIGACNDAIMDL